MDLNHEGIYYGILSDKPIILEIDPDYITGYEHITKEIIHEILVTYFGVDFGYDVEKWKIYSKSRWLV